MKNKDHILLERVYNEMAYGISSTPEKQGNITKSELINIIKEVEQKHKGTNFFSVTQVTRESSNKAPSPSFVLPGLKHGKAYFAKVSQVNGQIGFDYTAAVNRQREREGKTTDFVAQKSVYDDVEGSTSLRQKEGQIYLRYLPVAISASFSPVLVKANKENPNSSSDFEVTNKDEVSQYKSPSKGSASYQGVEKGIEPRIISIDSIAAININGTDYFITDLDSVRKSIYEVAGAPKPQEATSNPMGGHSIPSMEV
jgi:hypothetical protein